MLFILLFLSTQYNLDVSLNSTACCDCVIPRNGVEEDVENDLSNVIWLFCNDNMSTLLGIMHTMHCVLPIIDATTSKTFGVECFILRLPIYDTSLAVMPMNTPFGNSIIFLNLYGPTVLFIAASS